MRLKDLAISESGFVFDPAGGGVFTVNGTGKLILHLVAEGTDPGEIERLIRESYRTEGADVGRDVSEFLASLRDHRLLDGEPE